MVVYHASRCSSLERRILVPPNLGGQAMIFPKTSASQGFGIAFAALCFCSFGCFRIFRSDLSACLYSTSFKVSAPGGGALACARVGGFVGGSGGSLGAGGGADGAGVGGGADLPNSRSSNCLNFRSKSSSKLSSCCLVKPAMVMETIGLSGSSIKVIHRNSSRFCNVDLLQILEASMDRMPIERIQWLLQALVDERIGDVFALCSDGIQHFAVANSRQRILENWILCRCYHVVT